VTVAATVVVDGVMLQAEDNIMTSSTDETADDADEHIPLWIGNIRLEHHHTRAHIHFFVNRQFCDF